MHDNIKLGIDFTASQHDLRPVLSFDNPEIGQEIDNARVESTTSAGELVSTLASVSKLTKVLCGIRLSEIGCHNGQDDLLAVLSDGTSQTVNRIAEEMCVRPSTASKMIDGLVERGLLQRAASQSDRRSSLISITPQGLEFALKVRAVRGRIADELSKSFSPRRLDAVHRSLKDIEEVLKIRVSKIR